MNVKGPGVDIRFRDELKGVINPPVDTKLQILLINKITRSLNISVKKNKRCYYFSYTIYSSFICRSHHQSDRFFYSYNKILKVKKLKLFATLL